MLSSVGQNQPHGKYGDKKRKASSVATKEPTSSKNLESTKKIRNRQSSVRMISKKSYPKWWLKKPRLLKHNKTRRKNPLRTEARSLSFTKKTNKHTSNRKLMPDKIWESWVGDEGKRVMVLGKGIKYANQVRLIADTGASKIMTPTAQHFITYTPVVGEYVFLGDNHPIPIAGKGTIEYQFMPG